MYRFTDHPADYGVEVEAKSPEDAFVDAVRAVYEIMFGESGIRLKSAPAAAQTRIVRAEPSYDELLVFWLDWHLERYSLEQQIAVSWNLSIRPERRSFDAQVGLIDARRAPAKLLCEIKGVTHHDLEILTTPDQTKLKFIVDV